MDDVAPPTAARQLLAQLSEVRSFPRFPEDPRTWTSDQVGERFPAWQFVKLHWDSKRPPGPVEGVWVVYGAGRTALIGPNWRVPVGACAGGSGGEYRYLVDALLSRPAVALPDQQVLNALVGNWRETGYLPAGSQPEVLVRNEWAERASSLTDVRTTISQLASQAARAVRQAGGDSSHVRALLDDRYLYDDVLDEAVRELQRAIHLFNPTPQGIEGGTPPGPPARLTGKEAAELIGVSPGTFSRWRSSVPAWAQGEKLLFQDLVDRDGQHHRRDKILRLKRWHGRAMEDGGQRAIECP